MGKARGVSRRRRKKYNYNVNKKRLHKKLLKLPDIECSQIRRAWDNKKSILNNMQEMGLSADPNKTLKVPSAKELLEPMELDNVKKQKKRTTKPPKLFVAKELENEAKMPQPNKFRLPNEIVKYCIYMLEKYGEDYKAMARDPKNYQQDTPAQIRRKIQKFQSIPEQWNKYLRKNEGSEI
ncbi:nucleolar protein 16 [Centruroides vittatus]|uniref:nucleolar protein 16 n=1 Tax=Centruroides vittatus TaxID=120091 RepID=UPI00350F4235